MLGARRQFLCSVVCLLTATSEKQDCLEANLPFTEFASDGNTFLLQAQRSRLYRTPVPGSKQQRIVFAKDEDPTTNTSCATDDDCCYNLQAPAHCNLFCSIEIGFGGVVTGSCQPRLWLAQLPKAKQQEHVDMDLTWADVPSGHWAWPTGAIYQLMIDRFASLDENPCIDLTDYCGGTFRAAEQRLDYLTDLGIDGILIAPVVENMPRGYHGFWTKDLDAINPRFGSEADLQSFIYHIHGLDMKVFATLNLNSAGSPKQSDVSDILPFNDPKYFHQDDCTIGSSADVADRRFMERCKVFDMQDYNHEQPEVWEKLTAWTRQFVDKFSFDGIHVDAANHIPKDFLLNLPADGPPIPSFYSLDSKDVQEVKSYATSEYSAVYNFPLYYCLASIFAIKPHQPMLDLVSFLSPLQLRISLNFIDNQFLPPFSSLVGNIASYHSAIALIATLPGLPIFSAGSELDLLNISSTNAVDSSRTPLWNSGYNRSGGTFEFVRRLIWLRKRLHGLHHLATDVLLVDADVLVFRRGKLIVATSRSPSPRNFTVHVPPATVPEVQDVFCSITLEGACEWKLVESQLTISFSEQSSPLVLVPSSLFNEYQQETKSRVEELLNQSLQTLSQQGLLLEPVNMIIGEWQKVTLASNGEAIEAELEPAPRFSRALRSPEVPQIDQPNWPTRLQAPFDVPDHLDVWHPPIGIPVLQALSLSIPNACACGQNAVAMRPGVGYVFCYSSDSCNSSSWSHGLTDALDNTLTFRKKPLLFLTFEIWGGIFHDRIEKLPRVVKYLTPLREGKMELMLTASSYKSLSTILTMLGIPRSSIIVGEQLTCSERLHIEHIPPAYLPPIRLQRIRSELLVPFWRNDVTSTPSMTIFISRGNNSRTVTNEAEVLASLKSLGRPVELILPNSSNLIAVMKVFARAKFMIGPHGANMHNIIFGAPGAMVMEIVPLAKGLSFVNYHYRSLSGALGFTYRAFGQADVPFDAELAANVMTQHLAVRSFKVNTSALKKAAEEFLMDIKQLDIPVVLDPWSAKDMAHDTKHALAAKKPQDLTEATPRQRNRSTSQVQALISEAHTEAAETIAHHRYNKEISLLRNALKEQEPSGPIARIAEENVVPFASFVFIIVVAGIISMFRELVTEQALQLNSQPRDSLWDIVKFILLWCVLDYHWHSMFATCQWYDNIKMPGFLIISGFLQQGQSEIYGQKVLERVLRDNVLNNLLFALFFLLIMQPTEDGTLWFLWALALYRLLLFPLFKVCTYHFGPIFGGALLLTVMVFTTPEGANNWSPVYDKLLLLKNNTSWNIAANAVYYSIGLVVDRDTFRQCMKGPLAFSASLVCLITQWLWFSDNPTMLPIPLCVARKTIPAFALMGLMIPIADSQLKSIQFWKQLVARAGSRTLYGYYVHMMLRFTVTSKNFRASYVFLSNISGSLAIFCELLLLAAVCSPLCERCFRWMVSPQWLIEVSLSTRQLLHLKQAET